MYGEIVEGKSRSDFPAKLPCGITGKSVYRVRKIPSSN